MKMHWIGPAGNGAWAIGGLAILLGLFVLPAPHSLLNRISISLNADTVVFESLESKTNQDLPVYNEVSLITKSDVDVWTMRQSHVGYPSDPKFWDRLMIRVDKTQTPHRAEFYQLAPGDSLTGLDSLRGTIPATALKARCFACHANGPRAIRPRLDSPVLSLGMLKRLRILGWNLRIKFYGHVDGQEGGESDAAVARAADRVPFRSKIDFMARPLGLSSCMRCHDDHGIRNGLKLEQVQTALFLVENGFMPPLPFSISSADRQRLRDLASRSPAL